MYQIELPPREQIQSLEVSGPDGGLYIPIIVNIQINSNYTAIRLLVPKELYSTLTDEIEKTR